MGVYGSNPLPLPPPSTNAPLFDVHISDASTGSPPASVGSGTSMTITFYFTARSPEQALLFYDTTTGSYQLVQGSTLTPESLVAEPLEGQITVVFDSTSFPAITDLGGTVFTVALPPAGDSTTTADVSPDVAQASIAGASAGATSYVTDSGGAATGLSTTVTFQTSSELGLNLTPLQDSRAVAIPTADSSPATDGLPLGQPGKSGDQKGPLQDLLNALGSFLNEVVDPPADGRPQTGEPGQLNIPGRVPPAQPEESEPPGPGQPSSKEQGGSDAAAVFFAESLADDRPGILEQPYGSPADRQQLLGGTP